MIAVRVFVPFALGYFLSYLLRVVNAVIAPDLVRDLGLTAADLGLLTSANFFAFAVAQLPLGIVLGFVGVKLLLLSAPPIVVAAVVGMLIAFIQAATQLQEQTLQYVAKFFAIVITIFITASLLGGGLYQFGDRVFSGFAGMVRR